MNEETFIFSWEVKNFSLCRKEQGSAILIQKFRPFFNDSKWLAFLRLNAFEDTNFLTFVLMKDDNPANVEYRITLQLLSNDGMLRQEITPNIIVPGKTFRFSQFMSREELEQSCLCDDTLKLQCTFKKLKEMITSTVFTCTHGHIMKFSEKWSLADFPQAPLGKVLQKSIKSLFDVCLSIEEREGLRVVAINFTRRYIRVEQPLSLNALISVLNAKGVETEIFKQDQHVFCSTHEVWQFPIFITQTSLVEQKYECMPNDILTLKCDIAINVCLITSKIWSCVRTNTQFVGALAQDMKDLYASKRFADVNLCASGVTLAAHRIILHSRSKEFAKMLDEIEGTNNNFLDVPDVDIITLERMLKYMYTDEIEHLEHDDAVKLTLASCKYGIESLECKYSDDTINVFTDSSRNIRIYYLRI